MTATPVSLLERLRLPAPEAAWQRFVELYAPLIHYWARRTGLRGPDADDLVQEVFALLLQKLPEHLRQRRGSFRSWLRTVTLNKWREKQRREARVASRGIPEAGLAGPDLLDAYWEDEHRRHLVRRALQVMQAEFQPATWKACWEVVVADRPAAEVADELGLTVNAVYLARPRVLRRLRSELAGLLD